MKGTRTLKNGYIVLKEEAIEEGDAVLLCMNKGGSEFVTWVEANGALFWGHYTKDLMWACEDFQKRCDSYNKEV